MTFKELNITEPILKAIEEKGYTVPTPIQEKAIPVALAKKDILGCAQTGTGRLLHLQYLLYNICISIREKASVRESKL